MFLIIIQKKGKIRNNDPIVECFGIETLVDKCICVVTSCKNYGPSCKETSALARNTFLETLREEKIHTTFDALGAVLRAIHSSHEAIIKQENVSNTDSISLIGGCLLCLYSLDSVKKYIFIYASIGNCKAFYWDQTTKIVTDISDENYIDNMSSIGKGPTVDLESGIQMYMHECQDKDDILLLMSPIVYQNCDPVYLGIKPKDIGLKGKTWMKPKLRGDRSQFWCDRLTKIINDRGSLSIDKIVESIIDNTMDVTEPRRSTKEIGDKDFDDDSMYIKYPGKMGHATCVALKTGFN